MSKDEIIRTSALPLSDIILLVNVPDVRAFNLIPLMPLSVNVLSDIAIFVPTT